MTIKYLFTTDCFLSQYFCFSFNILGNLIGKYKQKFSTTKYFLHFEINHSFRWTELKVASKDCNSRCRFFIVYTNFSKEKQELLKLDEIWGSCSKITLGTNFFMGIASHGYCICLGNLHIISKRKSGRYSRKN